MKKALWGLFAVVLLVAGCGGGGDPTPAERLASAPLAKSDDPACLASSEQVLVDGQCLKVFKAIQPQAAFAALPPQRALPMLTDTALFDWAQIVFDVYFSGPFVEGNAGPYHYRYYFNHGNYLAVANGIVYVLGPLSGFEIAPVGYLSDFTCSVFDCSGGGTGGGGGSINWNSAFSAAEIIDEGPTLAAQGRQGWSFDVTGGSLPVESIFAAQFKASLYVMPASELSACVNGRAFNYYPDFSFANGVFGFMSFDLSPGSYGVCLVNDTNASNATRIEFQNRLTVDGFHFTQSAFTTIAKTMANGARMTQPVTVGDNYRVIVDGGNSGGEFFIIPASEQQNFLNGASFQIYSNMTDACTLNGRAAPGLCELTGFGDYAIAYRNNTGSSQSIVVTGRVFFPD